MMGVSYPGWLTVVAMLDPHPALKAVSPQASPADMFIGDDFHHNGAFRLSYGFEYAVMMETNKERAPFAFNDSDTYDWYLKLGSLAHVNETYLHENDPELERLRQPSELRLLLATAGGRALRRSRQRADAECRGLVGPGGLLRSDQDLRAAREARHEEPELPRRRSVESRRLERSKRPAARQRSTSDRDVAGVSSRRCRRRCSRTGSRESAR